MLCAIPKSIFSWGFDVYWQNDLLAVIDMAWMTEGGSFEYEGCNYCLSKEGFLSGSFSLHSNGDVIAEAEKTALVRCFEVRYGEKTYELRAASPFTRCFVLRQNGDTVGEIAPNHPFTRRCNIDLPEEISVPGKLFMFWLVLLMGRRSSQSAAASC